MGLRRDTEGCERRRGGTGNATLRPGKEGLVRRNWEPRVVGLHDGQSARSLHQGPCGTLDAGSRIISADIAAPCF